MNAYEHWYRILDDFRCVHDDSLVLRSYGEGKTTRATHEFGYEVDGGDAIARSMFLAIAFRAGCLLVDSKDDHRFAINCGTDHPNSIPVESWLEHVEFHSACSQPAPVDDPDWNDYEDVYLLRDIARASAHVVLLLLAGCYHPSDGNNLHTHKPDGRGGRRPPETDKERSVFAQPFRAKNPPLSWPLIAELYKKQTGEPVDDTMMRQSWSLYQKRKKALKN